MGLKAKLTSNGEDKVKPQVIDIEDITHLGRSDDRKCKTDRVESKLIEEARFFVKVLTSDSSLVSRNQAIVYPPKDLEDHFTICDLNSANGTQVNGEDIPRHQKIPLEEGSLISLGNEIRFVFRIDKDQDINYGLMVGSRGSNLKATSNDVEELRKELEKRGFKGNIISLTDIDASKDNILRKFSILKDYLTPYSLFAFYFSGHCNPDGNLVVEDRFNRKTETLSAQELTMALSGFRGKILMILDGCYTWSLAEQLDSFYGAVIGNDGQAYEGHLIHGNDSSPRNGYTTRAIIEVLKKEPHHISVNDLVDKLRENEKVKAHQCVNSMNTAEIRIRSRKSSRK